MWKSKTPPTNRGCFCFFIAFLFSHGGKQGHCSGALDRLGQLSLMFGAGAGSFRRKDLCPRADKSF